MTQHAVGSFEVKVTPLDPAFKTHDNSLGRLSIDKQFHGDLEATSKGEMLTGTGTFILQHSGTMQNGAFHLNVIVVPDSGTGQLAGLSGTMTIIIADGKHSYAFAYTLSDAH